MTERFALELEAFGDLAPSETDPRGQDLAGVFPDFPARVVQSGALLGGLDSSRRIDPSDRLDDCDEGVELCDGASGLPRLHDCCFGVADC